MLLPGVRDGRAPSAGVFYPAGASDPKHRSDKELLLINRIDLFIIDETVCLRIQGQGRFRRLRLLARFAYANLPQIPHTALLSKAIDRVW